MSANTTTTPQATMPFVNELGAADLLERMFNKCEYESFDCYTKFTITPMDLILIRIHYSQLLINIADTILDKYPLKNIQPLTNDSQTQSLAQNDPQQAFDWFLKLLDGGANSTVSTTIYMN